MICANLLRTDRTRVNASERVTVKPTHLHALLAIGVVPLEIGPLTGLFGLDDRLDRRFKFPLRHARLLPKLIEQPEPLRIELLAEGSDHKQGLHGGALLGRGPTFLNA